MLLDTFGVGYAKLSQARCLLRVQHLQSCTFVHVWKLRVFEVQKRFYVWDLGGVLSVKGCGVFQAYMIVNAHLAKTILFPNNSVSKWCPK